jgi:hypothetical protein
MLRTIALAKKIGKQAKCTINAPACHVRSQGKNGHSVGFTRELPKREPADWANF